MSPSHKLQNTLMLCAILLAGLALRLYNLDFPSIGYHNMQENGYMAIAHEMERTHDYVTKRVYFGDLLHAKADPEPPLVSYQTIISWRIFGENLWGPRLFNVIFGVSAILIIYFISNLLFNDRRLALFASLSLAVMPLAVFFSRNLQPESPALFFMLLGSLFYLKFISTRKNYNLILGGLSFSAAWLYKFSFIIGILPFLFLLPLKSRKRGDRNLSLSGVLSLLAPYSVIAIAAFILLRSGQFSFDNFNARTLLDIFSPSYWKEYGKTIWFYMRYENFTPIFILLSILGIIMAFFKRKSLADRYIIGWTATAIPYLIFFSGPIAQNNYCQMPFLILVSVSTAYAASSISEAIKKIIKKDALVIVLIMIAASSGLFVRDSIMRMHSTVFAGVDVAGESLRGFTNPGERIFLLTHAQGNGIARYAQRYADWTYDLKDFKDKEKKFGIRYLCVYPAEFIRAMEKDDPGLFNYIKNNYHIKEAGLTDEPQYLFYVILEKGEGSKNFTDTISGERYLKTIYRIAGRYIFFYVLRPAGTNGAAR